MFGSVMDEIRKENAEFARDLEYIKESYKDDILDERLESATFKFESEKASELNEALEMVNMLSEDVDIVEESAEIDRILNSEEDITFNEMVGIE